MGRWVDLPCFDEHPYLCEYGLDAIDPMCAHGSQLGGDYDVVSCGMMGDSLGRVGSYVAPLATLLSSALLCCAMLPCSTCAYWFLIFVVVLLFTVLVILLEVWFDVGFRIVVYYGDM